MADYCASGARRPAVLEILMYSLRTLRILRSGGHRPPLARYASQTIPVAISSESLIHRQECNSNHEEHEEKS